MRLEETDRRLLRELQRDASLSMKELAERTAMSQSTAWRRVQDMEEAGVITGRVTLADPEQLGLTVSGMISVNMADQTKEGRREFEAFAKAHENVQQCFSVTGSHDYVLIIRTRDVKGYETFLMEELLSHPSVASTQSQLILRHYKNSTVLPV
ncbi:Lrp/AsnC family transcriptional regulator [Oricola sp.]|uniref:Lrp/AsnC family transcriptional regulator n=1 Tax=Oricola sp. TaxID=1979950 RepID=UPI003516C6BF